MTVSFEVESLRKIPDPVNPGKTDRYLAVCKVQNLPLGLPFDTNPREQNLKSPVSKKIRASFESDANAEFFHLLSRGILLSAEKVTFDNETNLLTLTMPNPEVHGLVDGGHSYRIVTTPGLLLPDAPSRHMTLEIMTGVESVFDKIAGARNTSVQVKEKSLAELEGKLEVIKGIVSGQPFENDIAYVEFEDKRIDVLEVIALLTLFHVDLQPKDSQPIYCYSSKGRTLQMYLANVDSYRKLAKIAPTIFKLFDEIKRTFPEFYKRISDGGHFGKLREIGYKDQPSWDFYYSAKKNGEAEKSKFEIPDGFVYPIMGSLRFLVDKDAASDAYVWKSGCDPVTFYKEQVGPKLVALTMEASYELGRNPNGVGKSPRHWNGLYDKVVAAFLTK